MSEDREREESGSDAGFKVRDRRIFSQSESPETPPKATAPPSAGQPPEPPPAAEPTAGTAAPPQGGPLPEIDFGTFVISLSTSALYHLGAIPDPDTKQAVTNLPLAQQTIDILGMLRDKTRGNLTPDEVRLLDGLLYDLRIRFVEARRK